MFKNGPGKIYEGCLSSTILLGPFMNTLSPNDEFLLYTVANYSQLGNWKNSFHLSLIIGSSKHGSSPSFGINCAVGTQDFPKS